MIRLDKVSKHYSKNGELIRALDQVNLDVADGAFVSVIGPSGSGKTTLMNILGCLDTPTVGTYWLAGRQVGALAGNAAAEMRNRQIGFIFQNFNLISSMSALENVELPLLLRGMAARERREMAEQALAQVGLAERRTHRPNELSGGQQQRVAIARVLASCPQLILADEPTGNLDTSSGQEILSILHNLHRQGKTIVMITHDRAIAATAPQTYCMESGKLHSL